MKILKHFDKHHLIILCVFYVAFLFLAPIKHGPLDGHMDSGDDTGYYSYLRAPIFRGDLDFSHENNYSHSNALTPTGLARNYWYVGPPLLWSPFFLVGGAISAIYNFLGYPVTVDGNSMPFRSLTAMGSGILMLLALVICFDWLKSRFSRKASLFATMIIWLSSPVLFYTFIRPIMAHTAEAFVATAFVVLWLQALRSQGNWMLWRVAEGIMVGLLVIIHPQDAAFIILPLGDIAFQAIANVRFMSIRAVILTAWKHVVPLSIATVLSATPQLLVWQVIWGGPFAAVGTISGPAFAEFAEMSWWTRAVRPLASWDSGIVWWYPTYVMGLVGLGLVVRRYRELVIPFLAVFALQLIVVAEAALPLAYGQRYLIQSFPFFAFGLAALLVFVWDGRGRFKTWIVTTLILLTLIWQYVLMMQYNRLLPPYGLSDYPRAAIANIPQFLTSANLWLQPYTIVATTNTIWRSGGPWFYFDLWDGWERSFIALVPLLELGLAFTALLLYGRLRAYCAASSRNAIQVVRASCVGWFAVLAVVDTFIIGLLLKN